MNSLNSVFLPAADKESRRLMVVLHGLGDSSAGYQWLPPALGFPWLNYLLVDAPDEYYGGYSWFDIYGKSEPGVRRSQDLVTKLLDEQHRQGFPTEQTILFGFSQGCLMTLETGLRYPSRFAGLIGVSGYVLDPAKLIAEAPTVAKQQRVLVTHGTLDPLLPCASARRQIQALQQAGFPIIWHEFEKVHTIDDRGELPMIREFVRGGFEKLPG